jgi:eukaryotic-like serine/threonine-protein kinase
MGGKIQFGVYELDPEARELRKHGALIRLQEQPLQVLLALVERPGQIVTREEIRQRIWGQDTFVDFEQSLNKAVNRLREALCDDAAQPRYVETIPRRGYRFVAPVTGNTATEDREVTAASRVDPDLAVGKPGRHIAQSHKTLTLTVGGMVVAIAIGGVMWLEKPRKATPQEARHMTSGGFAPVLSRDGKLLAYLSGGPTHIWVRQTAAGEAIPVTTGPDEDFRFDFSPDGTQIVFGSTRSGGGLYVTPTLPGEPKLLVSRSGIGEPHFSPGGDKILYWQDGSTAVAVPVAGGQPIPLDLNRDFRVDGPPLWSPSGNEIIFYGVRKSEPEKAGRWQIVPFSGGDAKLLPLPGVTEGNADSIHTWMRTREGRAWIVYSVSTGDTWKLFRTGISAGGQIDEKPEQIASGTGMECGVSASEDGKLAYCTVALAAGSIYEIPTDDRGQKLAPTQQLPLGAGNMQSQSASRDGRWMAYDTTRPDKPNSILVRDLRNASDRLVDDKGRKLNNGGVASISPDGSKVIFERDCKSRGYRLGVDPIPCSFIVSVTGGEPEPVCEFCTPRGFSSNGSVVLVQKYDRSGPEIHDSIDSIDLKSKMEKDFLNVPGKNLYHAFFSWDDHWVVFKQLLDYSKAQIFIAPVRDGAAGTEAEWIAVTDGRYSDDKPQFSPDGNTLYFTSTRDGYLCIWSQKLNPTTKHPLGPPVAYEHFHNSSGHLATSPQLQWGSELTVARDKILINLPEVHTDIWMLQME